MTQAHRYDDSLSGKRIAFFHQSASLYGSDRMLLSLADGIQRHGVEPIVLLPHEGPLTQALASHRIEFHIAPIMRLDRERLRPRGLATLLREAKNLNAVCSKAFDGRQIDIVHSNTLAVLGGAMWSYRHCVPHLWHVHEIVERPSIAGHGFTRLLGWTADTIISNSNATRNWLLKHRPTLANRITVIHNGIDLPIQPQPTDVAAIRSRLMTADTELAVGLVGRINRSKGHEVMLQAMEQLNAIGLSNFTLIFVGDAPPGQDHLRKALLARIEDSPVRDRVKILGFIADMNPLYSALDLICVPSTEAESFGLVAAEAMSNGCAVIASDIGGLPEFVGRLNRFALFPPGDPNGLADALRRALTDQDFRTRLAADGRYFVETELSRDVMLDSFIDAYSKLLVGRK